MSIDEFFELYIDFNEILLVQDHLDAMKIVDFAPIAQRTPATVEMYQISDALAFTLL